MALNQLRSAWGLSSRWAQIGVVVGVLVIIGAFVAGTIAIVHHFEVAAYQKREQERATEREQEAERRQQDEAEKNQLRQGKAQDEQRAKDAEAERDAYKKLAASRRADRAQIAKELESVEAEHARKKQEIEANSGSMSTDDLKSEICRRFRLRGIPCPE